MPSTIYKGFCRGGQTLVNLEKTCQNGGIVEVPTGSGVVPLEAKDLPKVADKLKLSASVMNKIGKLKTDDNKSKKEKLKNKKPIVFDLYDKPQL